MGHAYAVRLHGMPRDVGIVAHVRVVEVGDLFVVGTYAIGEGFGGHGAG